MTISGDTTSLRVCDGYACVGACICPLMTVRVRSFQSGQSFAERHTPCQPCPSPATPEQAGPPS
eukprot:9832573-Lingulodinium_polyedra.AAC.1